MCSVPVDLAFIIDASGSIGSRNFLKILEFVAKIVDAFEIQENGTHVGVIHYSDGAFVDFDFNKFTGDDLNKENIVKEINKISVTEGQTRIDLALLKAKEELFTVAAGMRPDKPKVKYNQQNMRPNCYQTKANSTSKTQQLYYYRSVVLLHTYMHSRLLLS